MRVVSDEAKKKIVHEFLESLIKEDSPIRCLYCKFVGSLDQYVEFVRASEGRTVVICPRCNAILYVGRVKGIYFKKNASDLFK